jgi:diacylglycerol O-acyltransferase
MWIDRAGNSDLAFLAMNAAGPVPQQFAAILVFDRPVTAGTVARVLAERVPGVPRLRQRLVRTPPGCGRPIWVDDAGFDVHRHLSRIRCRPPGDEDALMAAALTVVAERLPADRPRWRAAVVDGLADGGTALVVVLQHVLADGIGGLAVLRALADGADAPPARPFPRPAPPRAALAADALRSRVAAVRGAGRTWRQVRAAMSAGGGVVAPAAESCSLLRPTGARRRAVVVHAGVAALRAVAHPAGATVNAALVSGLVGALDRLLAARGERLGTVVLAIMVGGRAHAGADRLGNEATPLVVAVPAGAAPGDRMRRVAEVVGRRRAMAAGPPAIGLVGPLFRIGAAVGAVRWYMNRQRRLHTLVSYVRGPDRPIRFAGVPVRALLPLGVGGAGNVTVSFQALSYAGDLAVCAVADPDTCPDLDALAAALRQELTGSAAVVARQAP